jgi:squalene-hopene/tetraprenyl-beta-curcumene cyclase
MIEFHTLLTAFQTARRELLAMRVPAGHWAGELSSSPFATASAAGALCIVATHVKEDARRDAFRQLAIRAVEWLAAAQTSDGSWGDTRLGPANLAATIAARAAIHLAGQSERFADALSSSQAYFDARGGLAEMRRQYRTDPALLSAVLGMSALAGSANWRDVPPIAFEDALLPRGLRRSMQGALAYAEPIRTGIGQACYFHRWPRNPFTLLLRRLSVGRSVAALRPLQASSGGLLDSAAWSGFFVMGLAATNRAEHPTARRALNFLLDTVRGDATWPSVSSLSVGDTAQAVNALASASGNVGALGCLDWLLNCQQSETTAPRGSLPGGWACNEGGGIPADVDSTASALMALSVLLKSGTDAIRPRIEAAATAGVNWLLAVQNEDGGWPTYFRGASENSPDGNSPELTAHALRALRTWQYWTSGRTVDEAIRRGIYYLSEKQRQDGSWRPRWFACANRADVGNLVYGTSQVVLAYRDLDQMENRVVKRALEWLARSANEDGGWSCGNREGSERSSVEETSIAVEALLAAPHHPNWHIALENGLKWLVRAVDEHCYRQPAAIGLLPGGLQYSEKVYPLSFLVSALGQAVKLLSRPQTDGVN